ncbi:MAG TPA: Ig-like domain-containing protein, partial [Gammaproteobacteria bacterium]
AMALLKSAVASSSVDEIESALKQSAVDVGSSGADNDYGFGVINVTDAYQLLQFNAAPIANDDYATTVRNYPVIIHLLENDTDVDGQLNQASISILSQPSRGVVVDNGDGTVTYTSTRFRAGTDAFSYSVRDDDGAESNPANVRIDISRR